MTDPFTDPILATVTPPENNAWETRYQTGDVPWDKGSPAPGLVDFLTAHPEVAKGTVCVPGCGLGHDVRAWAQAGFDAYGLDIAPSAIRLSRERTSQPGASYRMANFLEDPPFQSFDWVFEHTLFCAIQPNQRPDYVQAVRRWLKPEGHFLAVYYLIDDKEGPPFGTSRQEITELFSPFFNRLEDWVPRSYPNRVNLEWMVWWQPRPERESSGNGSRKTV